MKQWIFRAAGVIAILLVVAIAAAWLLVRGSLPALDGSIAVAGVETRATIERDADGIVTITAANRNDLAFATGFAHAQDRYFQMDLIRRQAAGELSELFGAAALPVDRYHRFHRFRARAAAVFDALDAGERAILEAYTAGVNAGLDSLSTRPFEYLLMRAEPRGWTAEDTILVVYAMFMQLNDDRARKDVRRGLAKAALPPKVYQFMYPPGTAWDAPISGEAMPAAPIPEADRYSLRGIEAEIAWPGEEGWPLLNGSNNWAVAGGLTPTGRALVSNDMHLGLSVPNIYYQARLKTTAPPQRDVTGVSLPGTPFVVAGSNGHIAWGYTNSYGDWSDAVALVPGETPDRYATADGDATIETHVERIAVKDAEPVEFAVRETRWGPIDESRDFLGRDIAVRWLAHDVRAVNLRIIGLETAASVAEALDIANTLGMPPQNFVVGDADGNIGWTIAGQIPVRSDFDPMVPADWSDGDGWLGWLDVDDYPRVLNPDSDRIWTANARVVDGDALDKIGDGGYDLGARSRQIRERLFENSSFRPRDMLAIQTDHEALFLSRWRLLLLDTIDAAADPSLDEYRHHVDGWSGFADAESVGYRLVRAFRFGVRRTVFDALMTPVAGKSEEPPDFLMSNQFEGPLWSLLAARPSHLLPGNFESWDALLLSVVRHQHERFSGGFDGDLEQRTWGEYNTASIRHPISRAVPALSRWLDMPREPLDGDANLPLAQGPSFGASERFSVSPGDEANGLMQMPTGQSGHPMSPFYRRGHADWVAGRPSPFLPGQTEHTLVLEPSG